MPLMMVCPVSSSLLTCIAAAVSAMDLTAFYVPSGPELSVVAMIYSQGIANTAFQVLSRVLLPQGIAWGPLTSSWPQPVWHVLNTRPVAACSETGAPLPSHKSQSSLIAVPGAKQALRIRAAGELSTRPGMHTLSSTCWSLVKIS